MENGGSLDRKKGGSRNCGQDIIYERKIFFKVSVESFTSNVDSVENRVFRLEDKEEFDYFEKNN